MFIANKKLRSLRSLRRNWLFIANKTPLASLAPSKFVSLLIKISARFARSVKAFLCCKYFPPLGLCISCCIYTWIMLAAYATCDDYPHNAYPWRFLNFKIYCCLGSALVSFEIFGIPNFQVSRSQISKFPEIWPGPSLGPGLGPP